ncbi:MAG: outer membrane lipoprotein carrier protein LolA [Geminicoccaceae bacterium]|nr:outer membrane lipoprotein carrier protein LolA [Geminicoccaceae bacterium]MCX7630455.1 outer membrane lipoprotein carrier protein LolA [Geminicoccaceae bacterium]
MARNRRGSEAGLARRRLLVLLVAIAGWRPARAALAPAEQELVRRVEAYFNAITTLEARFTQLAQDGRMATGRLWLARPGRLRLDYDRPSRVKIFATDWRVIFVDAAVKQVNVLPLSQTPLSFLLDREVKLSGELEVTEVQRRAGEIALAVIRAGAPEQGRVVVVLAERPLELRRWSITDPQGFTTTILLDELVLGRPIDPALFRFHDPEIFGWPEGW